MVMFPKVNIIVLNYNHWEDTILCLESLLNLDYKNFEITVVDNHSTDNSVEQIIRWAQGKIHICVPTTSLFSQKFQFLKHKPLYINLIEEESISRPEHTYKIGQSKSKYRITIIKASENGGYAHGNNLGIKYALVSKPDYIWILNNDTFVDKKALLALVQLAETNSKIGAVGSKLLYFDKPQTIQTLGGTTAPTLLKPGKFIHHKEIDTPSFSRSFKISGTIIGASMLIRAQLFQDVGFFDENYFMYHEELDWCMRVRRKGWLLYYCGKSKVWHKEGATSENTNKSIVEMPLRGFIFIAYYSFRNRIYFAKKFFGSKALIFIVIAFLKALITVVRIILFSKEKLTKVHLICQAFYDGILGRMGKRIDPFNFQNF